jgi:hypothetical protein
MSFLAFVEIYHDQEDLSSRDTSWNANYNNVKDPGVQSSKYSFRLVFFHWQAQYFFKDVTPKHFGTSAYMVRVIKMADGGAATENRFEADVKHIPLKLEPGAAYRVCIDSVMFHHEECQVSHIYIPFLRCTNVAFYNCIQCKDTMPKIGNKYSQKRNCAASLSQFHIHVHVSDLYIPTIGLPILLRKYVD